MTIEEIFDQLLSQKLNLRKLCKGDCDGSNQKCDICKATANRKELEEKLKEKLSILPSEDEEKKPSTFLTGSYARRTMIRPPKDVDFFIVLNSGRYKDDELDELIKPRALLKKLEEALTEICESGGLEVEPQRHSVTVRYDDEFSIDVIPAFQTDDGEDYLIPDVELGENGEYITSNPKKHQEYIDQVNENTKDGDVKRFKRIVRIIKSIKRDLFNEGEMELRSFHLELLAAKILEETKISSCSRGLSKFLTKVPDEIVKLGFPDPANEENLIDDYFMEKDDEAREAIKEQLAKLGEIAKQALVYEREGEVEKAIQAWAKTIPALAELAEESEGARKIAEKLDSGSVHKGSSSLNLNLGNDETSTSGQRKIASSPSWRA